MIDMHVTATAVVRRRSSIALKKEEKSKSELAEMLRRLSSLTFKFRANGAKIRVDNLHYDLSQDDLYVRSTKP